MASDDPFISTTDLSNYLGRDVSADEGALIAIDAACNIVRNYIGQTFNRVTGDTVAMDGTGTDCIVLPQSPATAAGTVTLAGVALVPNVDYVLAGDVRLIRTDGTSYSTIWSGYSPVWPVGRGNVVVTYDHGYAGTVPSDVRMVALQVSARIALQGIVTAETLASQALTYATPALDMTPGEKLILQGHRAY